MCLQKRVLLLWTQNNYGYNWKRCSRTTPIPPLLLQNFPINLQSSARFLGLIFDHNISCTPHIKSLKAKCNNSINTLIYLSHPHTGCDRKLLLQLYKSIIRSQIDHGSSIFKNACKSSPKLLDSIQSSALRLAFGALRSSPPFSASLQSRVNFPFDIAFLGLFGPMRGTWGLRKFENFWKMKTWLPIFWNSIGR